MRACSLAAGDMTSRFGPTLLVPRVREVHLLYPTYVCFARPSCHIESLPLPRIERELFSFPRTRCQKGKFLSVVFRSITTRRPTTVKTPVSAILCWHNRS